MSIGSSSSSKNVRRGFTLVELLVVIAIIGVLVALLLPAIQAAREAARRMECAKNMKMIALGFLTHEETHGHYPTGGFKYTWLGDPTYGFGREQPGSWPFNILPYIEQIQVYEMGSSQNTATRIEQLSQMTTIPIPTYYCPSRRAAVLTSPQSTDWVLSNRDSGGSGITMREAVAKTDYGACTGAHLDDESGTADAWDDLNVVVPSNYNTITTFTGWKPQDPDAVYNGVCYFRSMISSTDVTDGTNCCYLVGEKVLALEVYDGSKGKMSRDNETAYTGFNRDFHCSAHHEHPPKYDRDCEDILEVAFGSAHPDSFHMAFCDGSVHQIEYSIDPFVHERLGVRDDGGVVDMTSVR